MEIENITLSWDKYFSQTSSLRFFLFHSSFSFSYWVTTFLTMPALTMMSIFYEESQLNHWHQQTEISLSCLYFHKISSHGNSSNYANLLYRAVFFFGGTFIARKTRKAENLICSRWLSNIQFISIILLANANFYRFKEKITEISQISRFSSFFLTREHDFSS